MTYDDTPVGLAILGGALKRLREAAGLTQAQLAQKTSYSRSQVNNTENVVRLPSIHFIAACDEALGTGDLLSGILAEALRDSLPSWAVELAKAESDTVAIRHISTTFFPGVVQTRSYARNVLNAVSLAGLDDDELDSRVELRMRRREILTSGKLRSYHVILDEAVLRRVVGGPEVLREQIEHLLSLIRQRLVTVQVFPFTAGQHAATAAVMIMELENGDLVAYEEGLVTYETTGHPPTVRACVERFDALRSQALSVQESVHLIEARLEEMNRDE